jgi:phage-related protein
MGLDYEAHGDLFQEFTLTFSCPDPYWYVEGDPDGGFDILGINFFMGVSKLGGETGGGFSIAAEGVLTEATASNNGNAPTVGRITIRCSATQTCENPIIQRILNGQVYDYVSYTGVLGNGDELIIDSRGHSVQLNGDNAYGTAFDFKHPRFIKLEAGENLIRVLFTNATDEARVTLTFEDAFYGS